MNEEEAYASVPFTVYAPLSWENKSDGKLHLVDVEANEDYGFYIDGKMQMYNLPSNSDLEFMVYGSDEVEHAQEGDIGYVEIHTTDGEIFIHKERTGPAPEELETINLNPINWTEKNLFTTEQILRHTFPNIDKTLYRNVLDGRLMMDTSLYGSDAGHVPYMGRDSPQVINVCQEIEKEVHPILNKKGEIVNLHYETNQPNVYAIMKMLADRHVRNLFVETIRRIHWDGVRRIPTFLERIGCTAPGLNKNERHDYLEVVLESFLLSVIERNLIEDYKSIQFVPVLIGGQGVGKSTFCEKIGLKTWYRSCAVSVHDQRRFHESVQGATVVELKEGTQFHMDDDTELKAAIDTTQIQFRKAYAAESTAMPVYYSMIVTTNDETILSDQSGNRRFFPITMVELPGATVFDIAEEDFMQLWAEALVLFKDGKRWNTRLKEDYIKEITQRMQSSATQETPESDDIYTFVDEMHPEIGDVFDNRQFSEYLRDTLGRTEQEIRATKDLFGKHSMHYGFEFKGVRVRGSGLLTYRARVYERVAPPYIPPKDDSGAVW